MPAPGAAKPLKHFYEVPRDLLSRKGIEVRKHPKGLTGTLIVGDDTGLIKVISCKKKKVIKIWGEQNPVKRIKKLYWAYPQIDTQNNNNHDLNTINNSQKEFLAVLSNGDVRCYNSLVGSYKTEIKQETNIQGLYVMDNPCITDTNKRMVWTMNESGDVRLWGLGYNKKEYSNQEFPHDTMILNKINKSAKKHQNKNENDSNSFINLLKSQTKKNKDKHLNRGLLLSYFNVNTILKKEKFQRLGKSISGVNSKRKFDDILCKKRNSGKLFRKSYGYNKGKIKCIKGHGCATQFPWLAIGGNDRPVEIYDFNKQKCIFKGKHHFHYLGYKHSIIINDIDWCKKSVNPYLCAAVTSQSELKLYDMRTQKSIFAQKIGDYALNKVKIKSKKKILIGDSNANIWEFDYLLHAKERGYVYRRYRGFIGAIKDFDIHPTRNLFASVGLGRYVLVHRFNQPHLPLFKTYLKQKLNAVLFSTVYDTMYLPIEEKEKVDDDGDDDESKEVYDFVNDSEIESDHEEKDNCEINIGEDWKNKLDGYDTDELKELLHELQDSKKEFEQPPLKKRKINLM